VCGGKGKNGVENFRLYLLGKNLLSNFKKENKVLIKKGEYFYYKEAKSKIIFLVFEKEISNEINNKIFSILKENYINNKFYDIIIILVIRK
jgi:hypothetical protein